LTYAVAAAERGEHAVIFAFDEGLGTVYARCDSLKIPLRQQVEAGRNSIQQIDPAEMSPREFISRVRAAVEQARARVIVIDTLNGYLNAMPDERFLVLQMHELLSYLNQLGVVTILVLAQHGLMGPMQTPLDISYLSDTVVMLRYFEAGGEVRRAISVVKKRSGLHETKIREFRLGLGGLQLGPPLTDFRGIFTGTPTYTGNAKPLLADSNSNA
jgi:circadian clock protein KaiC